MTTDPGPELAKTDDGPSPVRGVSRRFVVALTLVVGAGLAWRFIYIIAVRRTVSVNGPNDYFLYGDAFYYHEQANLIARGWWYVEPLHFLREGVTLPSAGHPPFASAFYALASVFGFDGVTDHRLAAAVMGAGTVAIIGIVVWKLAGERAGIVAAVIAAAYPMLWINDAILLGETAAQFATALFLLAAFAFWRRPGRRSAVWLGLALGLAMLSRSELALCALIVVVPVCWLAGRPRVERRERAARVALAAVAAAALIAPWSIFNSIRFDQPVFLTTGQGAVLSAGACDDVFYGSAIGYYANCFQGPWPRLGQNEVERDTEPRTQAFEYIGDHLGRLPVVVAARVGRGWGVFRPGQTTLLDWSLEGRGRGASWIGLIMYYALLPFGVAGLIWMRRHRITILPIVGLAASFTFAIASTFGVTRYRAPFEVGLVVVGALGIDWMIMSIVRRRRSRRAEELLPTR